MGREHSRPEWRICVNFAVYFHEPVACLPRRLPVSAGPNASWKQAERWEDWKNGGGKGAREGEREARCMESSARLDIVSRYLELCVWVFALNRRTRRKTRGLLRPRGLSYQIDAADEGARGGNWDGPRGLDHFRTSVDWSRGPGTGPIPCCPLVLAAWTRDAQLVWDWPEFASLHARSTTLSLFVSLLCSPLVSSLFVVARIKPRIMSWRFYFLNKGWAFISPAPPPPYRTPWSCGPISISSRGFEAAAILRAAFAILF